MSALRHSGQLGHGGLRPTPDCCDAPSRSLFVRRIHLVPLPRGLRLPALGAAAVVTSLAVLPSPAATADGPRARSAFVDDTNSARTRHDRRDYDVRQHLDEVAQRWAEWMAAHRTMRHNPYLGTQVRNWSEIGENVGVGPGESAIQSAFMNSAPHRDNILSPSFRQIGVGAARGSDGKLYVASGMTAADIELMKTAWPLTADAKKRR